LLTKVAEERPYPSFHESAPQPPEIAKKPLEMDAAKLAAPKVSMADWARLPSVGTWVSSAYHPQLAAAVAELQEAATLAVKAEA